MTTIEISDDLAVILNNLSEASQRTIDDVIRDIITGRTDSANLSQAAKDAALLAMDGMMDSDITDMSTTVDETMKNLYRKKYGSSD